MKNIYDISEDGQTLLKVVDKYIAYLNKIIIQNTHIFNIRLFL